MKIWNNFIFAPNPREETFDIVDSNSCIFPSKTKITLSKIHRDEPPSIPNIPMYPKEIIINSLNEDICTINLLSTPFTCKTFLTKFRIIIQPNLPEHIHNSYQPDHFTMYIRSITKYKYTLCENKSIQININTIDNRKFQLTINNKHGKGEKFYNSLKNQIELKTEKEYTFFSLSYKHNFNLNGVIDGYYLYNVIYEMQRQGVYETQRIKQSNINKNYNICSSYPEITFIADLNNNTSADELYKSAAKYRARCRYPALTYYYKETSGSIWRCSQNCAGLNGRNVDDETIFLAILNLSNVNINKIIIYDARPMISAIGNKFKGGGYENIVNYKNATLEFCYIGNIQEVNKSFNGVKDLLTEEDNNEDDCYFWSKFENTGWPYLINQIIKKSIDISLKVKQGYSTVIHCSDGWDRTSQLCALTQILIDPYYRTLIGFIVLIEKDFISFGHLFRNRTGMFPKNGKVSEDQVSPIFLQFLDCVHQLMMLYPYAFEFNMELLLMIAMHTYSGKYGTFMYNSEQERKEKKQTDNSISIWTDVLKCGDQYKNPFYNEKIEINVKSFKMRQVRLWEEYFLKYQVREFKSVKKEVSSFEWFVNQKKEDLIKIEKVEAENNSQRTLSNDFFVDEPQNDT